jgi:hypothetical protein
MRTIKSPGALAAHGASEIDGLGRHVVSRTNRQLQLPQAPIRATLIGSNRCKVDGIEVRGYAPALELCRKLIAAGFNPASPLEAWRGDTLCLCVRSIGEGARLAVADDRHGTPRLRCRKERPQRYVAGSPIAQTHDGRRITAPTQRATWEAAT